MAADTEEVIVNSHLGRFEEQCAKCRLVYPWCPGWQRRRETEQSALVQREPARALRSIFLFGVRGSVSRNTKVEGIMCSGRCRRKRAPQHRGIAGYS